MGLRKFYVDVTKPAIDWICALVLIILLLPFLWIIAVILFIDFQGFPFFVQQRIGKGAALFSIIKFRSMKIPGDEDSMTFIGKLIRTYSIDELPQLLNILLGQMSFVGPRPLLPEYLQHYNSTERRRHLVKPGITGLTQVKGRNSIDWSERMKLDVQYVDGQSFRLDFYIILRSLVEVFDGKKVNYPEGNTITFSEYAAKR